MTQFLQILKCLTGLWVSQDHLSLQWQFPRWPFPWHLFNRHLPYLINFKVSFQCFWNLDISSVRCQSGVSLKTSSRLEHCISFLLLLSKLPQTQCLKTIQSYYLTILGFRSLKWIPLMKVSSGVGSFMGALGDTIPLSFPLSKGCRLSLAHGKSHQGYMVLANI